MSTASATTFCSRESFATGSIPVSSSIRRAQVSIDNHARGELHRKAIGKLIGAGGTVLSFHFAAQYALTSFADFFTLVVLLRMNKLDSRHALLVYVLCLWYRNALGLASGISVLRSSA
ncbi:hypothetical protein B0H16DRAFT_1796716 [Mycena metata]|uniref:Uncharacterized protein n=1 Tax=Mycena metata TaxID=1033252 RepID=A0AAD7JJN4_9AGAR|nr:hypothetical protein B0H16DRAFT_1796716 [Mycena metata]